MTYLGNIILKKKKTFTLQIIIRYIGEDFLAKYKRFLYHPFNLTKFRLQILHSIQENSARLMSIKPFVVSKTTAANSKI